MFLVLSRKRNETIHIDGPANIVVLSIRGDKCRLGVNAPASTKVMRGELLPVPPIAGTYEETEE